MSNETGMKNKVASGLFWKLLENGGAQGIQFVIAILLARLLTPAEYGVVGIIMIFITIANVFVQSGFSTALVQKKQADEVDFSSVCYFELAASVVFYALLYLAAPAIAEFYAIPVLKPIVRVLGIVLFPGAVISVQTAYVSRNMEFRGLFFSTLAASAVSGVISIFMAYRGFGVWAMVWQQISYYISLMVVLFLTVSWKPGLCFGFDRIRTMFAFGWKLLCASLLDTVFNNLYGLLIGKIYNEELLGSYNRGEQFPKLIATNLGAAIQAVLLPAFSACQDDLFLASGGGGRSAQHGAPGHPLKLLCGDPDAHGTVCGGGYAGACPSGRKMADLCTIFADHVCFLLLLADSYHESAGHQRSGTQRYLFKAGAGEEGFEYSGPGHRHAVQCVYHGVHQGISGFRVHLCQCGAEQKAAWL